MGGEVVFFFCNFLEAVETHRPKACVSAEEKAEEARCYGGTFETLLERWKLAFVVVKWGRNARRRVSPL